MSNRAVVTVLREDKIGIVANVSRVLSESGANIEDICQKPFFENIFTIHVYQGNSGRLTNCLSRGFFYLLLNS